MMRSSVAFIVSFLSFGFSCLIFLFISIALLVLIVVFFVGVPLRVGVFCGWVWGG